MLLLFKAELLRSEIACFVYKDPSQDSTAVVPPINIVFLHSTRSRYSLDSPKYIFWHPFNEHRLKAEPIALEFRMPTTVIQTYVFPNCPDSLHKVK